MARVVATVEIPAEVGTVWADVERLETHVEWMADAESIEFITMNRKGPGTVMNVFTRVGPFSTNDIIRVIDWEPPYSIGVVHEGVVSGEGHFRLEPTAGGTRFVWDEELRVPWYLGGPVSAGAIAVVLRWVWRRNLGRLSARFDDGEAQ